MKAQLFHDNNNDDEEYVIDIETSSSDKFPLAFNNPNSFPDFTIELPNSTVKCHRVFLALKSQYFNQMFSSKINGDNNILDLRSSNKISPNENVFLAMIRSFYFGRITEISSSDVIDLMFLCDQYEATECFEASVNYLTNHCFASNCLQLIELLEERAKEQEEEEEEKIKYRDVINANLDYIDFNFALVSQVNKHFVNLSCEMLQSLLNRKTLAASATDIVSAIFTWIEHDRKDRIDEAYDLLQMAKLDSLSTEELYVLLYGHADVGGHSWLLDQEDIVALVNEILMERVAKLQGFPL